MRRLSGPLPAAPAPPPARTPWSRARVAAETGYLAASVQRRLRGRDLALIAAGLTFYAGIAVVPLLLVAVRLTGWVAGADEVSRRTDGLTAILPSQLGAPGVVRDLVDAGLGMDVLGLLLAVLPLSLYGEGLRRALLRFSSRRDTLTGWRGRLLGLPLVLVTPLLLYPVLLAADGMASLAEQPGAGAAIGRFALGYYSVLFALTVPLAWGYRVVAAGRLGWTALACGALFTAACLSGFLQGLVLFLSLPLDLGAPFGGLTPVGAAVAIALWLFLLHLVLLGGWLVTQALDERITAGRLSSPAAPAGLPGAAPPGG
ncbi:YhjD/YihY/BrkB family envelope integrity protein [Trujillonella endophytica]|uniref:Membrane protein n=1 Tax=Trujillonella endophytica TaxID=673521 RepID=A0A1H8UEH6_9ACTN|nr:YhjD/YihY/BrkB family envelope integrity protein [Trujillella endophytica]SEP01028.1 membrane protein [Trujillella endophytica]